MRVLSFALGAGLFLHPAPLLAQRGGTSAPPPAADSAGVRSAVLDYVEAIYLADTARIVRSVRPELAKRGYWIPRDSTTYANEPMTYAELIGVARTWNPDHRRNPETMPKEIQILDLLDQTASAKLVAQWGVDYFHLARYDGRWMIVNILWQTPPAQHPRCEAAPRSAVEFAPHLADSAMLFRGQLSPDGQTLYYFRKVTPGEEDYRIYISRLGNGAWSPPEKILIGGDVSELYPTLTPDGRRLVFSSYQPVPGDTSAHPNAHLYVAERRGAGWGPPVLQRAASRIGWYHSGPMIGPDNALYFSITSPDWRTIIAMRSEWNGQEYGAPTPYSEAERWKTWRQESLRVWGAQPLPGDSVMLVYASIRKPGGGTYGTDLYATFRQAGGWSEPQPLGAGVNTRDGTEGFAFVSPDGCELLFTRDYSRFYHVSLAAALASARRP